MREGTVPDRFFLDVFHSLLTMSVLALPVAQQAMIVAPVPNGVAQLEPRFMAILQQCGVAEKEMDSVAQARVFAAGLFGHIDKEEDGVISFLKATAM